MAEKISTLVLKVDLNCCKCYNKIRKILCRFHCIKGQIYDEKNNTVTIYGPFNPIKFSKKFKCKAGDVIKNIEIKKEADKITENNSQNKDIEVAKDSPKGPLPVIGYPVPHGFCCKQRYEGHYDWGPWYHPGYGRLPPCYDAYGRSQCYCGCSGNRGNVSGCDFFVVEENPTTCTLM